MSKVCSNHMKEGLELLEHKAVYNRAFFFFLYFGGGEVKGEYLINSMENRLLYVFNVLVQYSY